MNARLLLLLVAATVVAASGSTPRSASTRSARAAEADTPWVGIDVPVPRARYGTYPAAMESLRAIVRRALGAWADSARWTSGPQRYLYRDQLTLEKTTRGTLFWAIEPRDSEVAVRGLRMTLATHAPGARGNEDIERALLERGWVRDGVYDADGPDGTHFVMISREALCDVQASWDGGDDSDTTYVPVPGERIELVCVPRPPRDPRVSRR